MNSERVSRQPARQPWTMARLVHERAVFLGSALDRSTRLTYSSALNSYLNFCRLHQFPVEPTAETLSFFVTFMSHFVKPNTVDSYLSGISSQLEPHFPNARLNRNSRLVAKTLAGAKRLRGSPTSRKAPLRPEDLALVVSSMPLPPSLDDLLFCAQLLTGFYGLLRLGELCVADQPALRNPQKLSLRHTVEVLPSSFCFTLPGHKADRFFEGNQILVLNDARCLPNPYDIFAQYLRARDSMFPYHPQLWVDAAGQSPTRRWFINRLRSFFPPAIAGQSMRAGGATALAVAGAAPHVIQAAGRWASETFQVYIRKNPILLQALIHPACDARASVQ